MLLGRHLETEVYNVMCKSAEGTVFENSIEFIGGQKFPDILIDKFVDGQGYFGVEVKSTKQPHWTTTGNSIFEGTRVDKMDRVFIIFGRMTSPIQFLIRPYEDCLKDIVVTHSPRYLIDMELQKGETIFDKLEINYDSFRTLENPAEPIVNYYSNKLKPGETVWWINGTDLGEQNARSPIIRLFNTLSRREQDILRAKMFVYFPEVFLVNNNTKYHRAALWMIKYNNIVHPSFRDIFSAGGKYQFRVSGKQYIVPKVIEKLITVEDLVAKELNKIDCELALEMWGDYRPGDEINFWLKALHRSTRNGYDDAPIAEYFSNRFLAR
jgi:hypothetical protein